MTEIIGEIMVEFLSVLVKAKEQIEQGRFSKHFVINMGYCHQTYCREIRKDVVWR